MKDRSHDDAMAEVFQKDPSYAAKLLNSILENGSKGELMIALRQLNHAGYRAALREVSPLIDLDPHPDTPEGKRLDTLVTLIEAYEDRHYPIPAPDPLEAARFRQEQEGKPMNITRYDDDVVAWASEQARLLRAGRFDLLDIEHLADEIEDVGKSEQRELASRMAVLLAHLLKWQYQPERQGSSWQRTITDQRARLDRRLKKTPSLQSCLSDNDWWQDAWADAVDLAARETGIDAARLPDACPWSQAEILSQDWLPAPAST